MHVTYFAEEDKIEVYLQPDGLPTDVINVNANTKLYVDSRHQPVFIEISNASQNTGGPWSLTHHVVTRDTPLRKINLGGDDAIE